MLAPATLVVVAGGTRAEPSAVAPRRGALPAQDGAADRPVYHSPIDQRCQTPQG